MTLFHSSVVYPYTRTMYVYSFTQPTSLISLLCVNNNNDNNLQATTRRNLDSVNQVFGNKLAILGGDFLLSRASVSLARLRNYEVRATFIYMAVFVFQQ